VVAGAAWRRCRVHLRNLLALIPKRVQTVTAVWVLTVFAQPDQGSAQDQLDKGGPSSGLEAAVCLSTPP
jgi:transposase-like protein